LPVAGDHVERNVEQQEQDPSSLLSLYRELLTLLRARPTLSLGSYASFDAGPSVLGYVRNHGSVRDVVLLNIGARRERVILPPEVRSVRVLLATTGRREIGAELLPDEGLVLTVTD
jgi:glycosidase